MLVAACGNILGNITQLQELGPGNGPGHEAADALHARHEPLAAEFAQRPVHRHARYAQQIHQVILNLMLNAADAMDGVDDRPRCLKIGTQAAYVRPQI